MIGVVYGTTGELIKLAPVLIRLRDRGEPFLNVTTGQQVQQIPALLDQLELPQPDIWLGTGAGGRDLRSNADIPRWLARVTGNFASKRSEIGRRLRSSGRPLALVHGDTMTTLLGTLMGRGLRVPVAHIEAGVRTWDLLHPFPEELTRRLVSRIADIHYAPGPEAAANLRRGAIVDTGMNTIRDSIALCPRGLELPVDADGSFGVVSLHRYELLKDERLLRETLEVLAEHARRVRRLLFVDHPVTVAAIRRWHLEGLFGTGLERTPRLSFYGFVELLRRSELVVTDSGGSQLEAYVLDRPCLVHRKAVEQSAGVGENVVVSGLSIDALRAFLERPDAHRRLLPPPDVTPSDVIVADLVERGFAA